MAEDRVPRISLIVATIGRVDEIGRLLESLCRQGRSGIEILLVDQNGDDRLVPLIARFSSRLAIVHLRAPSRGVCRARNYGAGQANGDWLMFPDDDCWYPDTFFATLDGMMARTPADLYSGRPTDPSGRTIMGAFAPMPQALNRETVWNSLMEWLVVVRRSTFLKAGGFDEALGPGSGTIWGAHEIQDMVLACLETGATGLYSPGLNAHHPEDHDDRRTPAHAAKMYRYGAGLGYVLRRHGFPFHRLLSQLLRPVAGAAIFALKGDWRMARRSRQLFLGRLHGWRTAPKRR